MNGNPIPRADFSFRSKRARGLTVQIILFYSTQLAKLIFFGLHMTIAYYILSGIFIFFLILPFLTTLFSLIFGKERVSRPEREKNYDYGAVITAYRNSNIAKGLVKSILEQDYPDYHIYLVADNCDISDWDIEHPNLTVFRPEPALNLKAKSIIHAMENYVRPHDYTVVFDADNVAHPDFFKVINKYANAGYDSIQGQRTAKNLDSVYACADAVGEFYKNYTERYAPYLLGGSAVISGSGMAVETKLYDAYLKSPEIEQGKLLWKKMLQEDKILQNFLLRKNEKIAYAWDAICYDEKVSDGEAVTTQRSRWLYSYFQNIPNSLGILRRGLFKFSFNQLYFGLVTIAPPLLVMMGVSGLLALLGLFINPWATAAFALAFFLFFGTIFWTLYLSKAEPVIWKNLRGLPLFLFRQLAALPKMINPNKNFKHTEHKKDLGVEELVK